MHYILSHIALIAECQKKSHFVRFIKQRCLVQIKQFYIDVPN